MTAEEKAEEYANKKCKNCIRYYCRKNVSSSNFDACNEYLFRKKHYLNGFAEGRKESAKDINALTKENKICEEIIIGEQQEINRLEKENAELKAQIEKLKCCGNCKHNGNELLIPCTSCDIDNMKWAPAE